MSSTESSTKPRPGKRRPDLDTLYSINPDGSHNVIHPADVKGRWQRRKKWIWAVLIVVYVVLPWIEIGGHPAILIDIGERHFYLFGGRYNAQDFNLFFFFVAGVGLSLFVLSALFGRVWCGFACPHTVFLEAFFRRVERWIEGNASKREKLAKGPWTLEKITKRGAKHAIYIALSLAISHVFLSYFIPPRELIQVVQGNPGAHWSAFVFIVVLTAILYFDFAWFREQLCLILCPYGRLQSVLYDPDTVLVGYDRERGEPRGHYSEEGTGSCIDCYRCVAVCPTGIDIRNGTQMECIGCSNCIDACDDVMAKIGEPPGLVRYDSERAFETGKRRFVRPRMFVYVGAVCLLMALFVVLSGRRGAFEVSAVQDGGQAFIPLPEYIRNRFQFRVVNKLAGRREFEVVPLNESEALRYVIGERKFALDELETYSATIFVDVKRSEYRPGLQLRLEVRSGDVKEATTAPLSGPGN